MFANDLITTSPAAAGSADRGRPRGTDRLPTRPPKLAALVLALTVALLAVLSSQPVYAGPGLHPHFLKAETALKSGQLLTLAEHEAALADHPLLPYLQALYLQQQLQKNDRKIDEDRLLAFLRRHEQTPFAHDLRTRWLHHLARKGEQQRFLRDYRASKDPALLCHYLDFRLQQETEPAPAEPAPQDELYRQFASVWLRATELPAACADLEQRWLAAGRRTPELLWQRLELALDDGNNALFKTLGAQLPERERAALPLWQSLHNRPELLNPALDQPLTKPFELPAQPLARASLLADALERLVWRDRDAALNAWEYQKAEQHLPPALLARVHNTIALALATDAHPAAGLWLARLPEASLDERMAGWRVTHELRQQHWTEAAQQIAALPAELRARPRFQYFEARLAALAGAPEAAQRFRALSGAQDYYGLLARSQLEQAPALSPTTLGVDAKQLQELRRLPALRRALALLDLDRISAARREWQYAVAGMSEPQLRAAAVLANEWGWTDRVVANLRQANSTGDWELLFPLPNLSTMQSEANRRQIDQHWAYAISRQESLFVADIKSSAGAIGLMQLMPATAKATAKKFKVQYRGAQELVKPVTNIRLGVAYLSELMAHNDGNLVYATAAYNAGQSRVNRWRARDGHLPLDIWIETIPFKETQGYVKNVTGFSLIYAHRLGETPTAFNQVLTSMGRQPLTGPKPETKAAAQPEPTSSPAPLANTAPAALLPPPVSDELGAELGAEPRAEAAGSGR